MEQSLTYIQIEENNLNRSIIKDIRDYSKRNPNEQLYIINTPLGDKKYSYPYQDSVLIILSPRHKLLFIDLGGNELNFQEFYDDFIEDLNSISDKYDYKAHIGRPREWKENNTHLIYNNEIKHIDRLLNLHQLNDPDIERVSELLISLLIGSINDISRVGAKAPQTTLEKVKKNIVLFDGEQTRFIYKEFNKKLISIQGLSGTGKTELLLHKLKEIYLANDNSKIFFTCHNIALASNLRERVPSFFNFMKVEKQIEWYNRLWVAHAWGSRDNPNSGLYSYLCNFYNVTFLRFNFENSYEKIFSLILEKVNSIEAKDFKFAFDYMLIDEMQDFPSIFFDLCKKITKHKVFLAGDIFQDIFENVKNADFEVDIMLNRCYRTDPRTLMFAHAFGLGLFEEKKLNWFPDQYWQDIGYKIERFQNREIHLYREPIRRFENLKSEDFDSVIIKESTHIDTVTSIIRALNQQHKGLQPDDIAIIILEENSKQIYQYIDQLCLTIQKEFKWDTNRAYENKKKIPNTIYISNTNNIKGLEFPFVICLTGSIKHTYKHRNILYTMLTRSFIQSYLLISDAKDLKNNKEGLNLINRKNYIKTIEPTDSEKKEIEKKLLTFLENYNVSYEDFLSEIFDNLGIEKKYRQKFTDALISTKFDKFDRKKTIKFIKANIEFYCQ